MGIYRYQKQQDGKLQDCATQQRDSQSWDTLDCPASERIGHSGKSDHPTQDRLTQDWQSSAPRDRYNWMQGARFVGLFVKNLSLLMTGGVALVSLLALMSVWRSGSNLLADIQGFFNTPQPEPQVDLRPMVIQQLQGASELTTAVFTMQTVVPTSRDRTVGGYVIGRTTLLYIAYGEVRAGVDLGNISPQDVQVSGDDITIRLPAPRILDRKIDVDRSQVYDYDRGFLGLGPDAATELQELAEQKTLDQVVAAACNQGILQTANERAQLTVTQLLSTAGFTNPSVETQPPSVDACPANQSLPPQVPADLPPPPPPNP